MSAAAPGRAGRGRLSRNRWQTLLHALAAAGGAALAIVVTRQQPEIADASGNAGAWAVLLVLAGAALACVAVVALTSLAGAERWRLPARATRIALAAAAAVVILVGALAGPSLASDAWDQFTSSNATVSQSDPAARLGNLGGNRHNIWDAALDAYRSEHLHGIGAGSFEFWWSRTSGPNYEFLRDAHNLYLEQLAELGLIGLALILALLASLAYPALRARRDLANPAELGANAALIAAFTVFLLHAGVDWMWEETALSALALTGLAIAAAASTPHPAAAPGCAGAGASRSSSRPRPHSPNYPASSPPPASATAKKPSGQATSKPPAQTRSTRSTPNHGQPTPIPKPRSSSKPEANSPAPPPTPRPQPKKNPPTHATGSSSPASKPNAGTPKQHSKPSKSQAAPTPRSRHPTALTQMTTALVHDYLLTMRGAERSSQRSPTAGPRRRSTPCSTTSLAPRRAFRRRAVNTSYLQRFPARQSRFRHLLPMFPRAVERLARLTLPRHLQQQRLRSRRAYASGRRPHLLLLHAFPLRLDRGSQGNRRDSTPGASPHAGQPSADTKLGPRRLASCQPLHCDLAARKRADPANLRARRERGAPTRRGEPLHPRRS